MGVIMTNFLGQVLLFVSAAWVIWRIISRYQTMIRFAAGRAWFSTRTFGNSANDYHHISKEKLEFGGRILERLSESLENNRQTVITQFDRLGAVHLKMSFLVESSFVDKDLFELFRHLDKSFHQIYGYRKSSTDFTSRSSLGIRMESLALPNGDCAWAELTDMHPWDMHELVFKHHPMILHGIMVSLFISVSIVTPETVSYYDKLRRDITDEQS